MMFLFRTPYWQRFLLSFIFFIALQQAQAQVYTAYIYANYPTYRQVFEYFHKNYDASLLRNTQICFAKNKEGWFVYTLSPTNFEKEPENMQLIWANKDKKWRFVQMPIRNNSQNIPRYIEDFLAKEYDKHLFYGYKGWHEDIIKVLGNEARLPDKQLESLARAYSDKSTALLFPHLDFQPTGNAFDKRFALEDMSETDLVNGLKSAELAIETYQKLLKQNPHYATPIGSIRLKLAHEYMTAYLNFSMLGDSRRAKNFLQEGIYEDFFVSFAKNMLNSCDEKGILITYGDNDTYPLLYAQEVLGIRKDITIININFLNKARYIHYLQKLLPESQKIAFSINLPIYQDSATDIVLLADKDIGIKVGFEEIIQDLNKNMRIISDFISLADGVKYLKVEAKQWEIPIKDGFSLKVKYFREYVEKQELALNDLIYSNLAIRPIYLASTMDRLMAQPYNEYIYLEGFVDKISTTASGRFDKVHWDKSYQNLKQGMEWKGINKEIAKDSAKIQLIFNYRYRFSQIASMLIENKQKFLALAVADQCYDLFPNDIVPYDFSMPYLASVYYQLNLPNKGDRILEICMQNIEKYLQIRHTISTNFRQKITEDYYFFADFCDLTAEKFERKALQQRAIYLKGRVVGG